MSAVVCINDGDTHNAVIEALEAKNPVIIERYALRPDSGGAGLASRRPRHRTARARGGADADQRARRAHEVRAVGARGRRRRAGKSRAPRTRRRRDFSNGNGKLDNEQLKPGDVLVIESGGGGGYGNPHERLRATVADDVRNGYVSHAAAPCATMA